MGTRNKPGLYDRAAAALDDEPTFTLLARSVESPGAVLQWADERLLLHQAARAAGSSVSAEDVAQVAEAILLANDMRVWRRTNLYCWRDAPRRERWAVVGIMGHRRHCGRIREIEQFGVRMLLVEVPTRDPGVFTSFQYGGPAIFCINPSDEATCRAEEDAEITPAWIGLDGGAVDGGVTATVGAPAVDALTITAGFFADHCALDVCPHEADCLGAGQCQQPKSRDAAAGLA